MKKFLKLFTFSSFFLLIFTFNVSAETITLGTPSYYSRDTSTERETPT